MEALQRVAFDDCGTYFEGVIIGNHIYNDCRVLMLIDEDYADAGESREYWVNTDYIVWE
jgi:hypothetical protein